MKRKVHFLTKTIRNFIPEQLINLQFSFSLNKTILGLCFVFFLLSGQLVNGQSWSGEYTLGAIEYARMVKLPNGDWLAVRTVDGVGGDGLDLQISRSTNNCRTWTTISTISENGRHVDNGQMLLMPDGSILMSCRSVIWGTSFRLPVYRSTNNGLSWSYLSTIDANEGAPGTIGGQGVYEPHLVLLDDGRVAAMYANETHVTQSPGYSQVISQRISGNGGASWGSEIFVAWEPFETGARPGMPVWTKMKDGRYIVVYEVCGTRGCDIYYKTSNNGTSWSQGLGTHLPGQSGAPYILQTDFGRLYVTSNNSTWNYSDNNGASWGTGVKPWGNLAWPDLKWSSLYQTGSCEVMATIAKYGTVKYKFGSVSCGGGLTPPSGYITMESYNIVGSFVRHQVSRGRIDQAVSPKEDCFWKMVPGLAGAGVSFESYNFPGRYLRHRNSEIWMDANDGTQLFAEDATFYQRNGLADASKVSFESYNFPGNYIRHSASLLYNQTITDDLTKRDATFTLHGSIMLKSSGDKNIEFNNSPEISLFPNPVDNTLNIKANITDIENIEVYNANGIEVLDLDNCGKSIDVSMLPGGIYFIKIQGEKLHVLKFIKK